MPKATTTNAPKTQTQSHYKSERLRLAEAIANFTKKQELFLEAHEQLKDYSDNIFKDLDLQIDTKQQELSELKYKYEHENSNLKIECDLNFKQYKYEAALKVLEDCDEVPIKTTELNSLKEELATLKAEFETKLKTGISAEQNNSHKALSAALTNAELKHKAETAEILAQSKQKEQQVLVLQATIDNLKAEISAQRELTKSVAEASQKGAINQTFGKQ